MALTPSVCIDAVLPDLNFDEALQVVKSAGIPAFEFWGWWDKDLDVLLKARDTHGLAISACCTKFVSLVDPQQREPYLAGLKESIAAAQRLDTKILISQVGDFLPGVERERQHASLVEGLREAAPMLEANDVTLVIEPLNELYDHVGYYLVLSREAFEIIDEVGSPNVKVVFDIYHQQISEGNLIHNLSTHIDKIGHFHAAGNPGRHELSNGEINYPEIIAAIKDSEYDGYLGLEYWPQREPLEGLQEAAGWCA